MLRLFKITIFSVDIDFIFCIVFVQSKRQVISFILESLRRRIGRCIPMDMEMIESSSLLEKHEGMHRHLTLRVTCVLLCHFFCTALRQSGQMLCYKPIFI